jgi:hypothetical protein
MIARMSSSYEQPGPGPGGGVGLGHRPSLLHRPDRKHGHPDATLRAKVLVTADNMPSIDFKALGTPRRAWPAHPGMCVDDVTNAPDNRLDPGGRQEPPALRKGSPGSGSTPSPERIH